MCDLCNNKKTKRIPVGKVTILSKKEFYCYMTTFVKECKSKSNSVTIATAFYICYNFVRCDDLMKNKETDMLVEEILKNLATVSFNKGEFIPLFQNNKKEIALIKKGKVSLMKSDINGNLIYIDHFIKNEMFSKLWIYNEENDLFFVCNTSAEIYFLDYTLFTQGTNSKYLNFFLEKSIQYMTYLNQKISILQKKSMEDKLLTYFRIESKKCGSKKFEITITYKELADYLGVDRSSLMRKLNELEKKKKIKKQGKTIFLKN